jgi:hypothetical protein
MFYCVPFRKRDKRLSGHVAATGSLRLGGSAVNGGTPAPPQVFSCLLPGTLFPKLTSCPQSHRRSHIQGRYWNRPRVVTWWSLP